MKWQQQVQSPNANPHLMPKTPPEQRRQIQESQKLARERRERVWVSATNSIDCIKKNLDRFHNRVNRVEELYPELHSEADNSHMGSEVKKMFRALRENNPAPKNKKSVKVFLLRNLSKTS
ncbi:hypothetical protein R1flu_004870 [Riccia fluitans]|uniref:Uncharacterized protein n=1 Tax=Riccia fluitans TaxID=41844 RepID=A0ABD1YRI5_9MARC